MNDYRDALPAYLRFVSVDGIERFKGATVFSMETSGIQFETSRGKLVGSIPETVWADLGRPEDDEYHMTIISALPCRLPVLLGELIDDTSASKPQAE